MSEDVTGETAAESAEVETARRLAESIARVDGIRALAPGLRDLVANAAARILGRTGGRFEAAGVDVSHDMELVRVRIDCHLDSTRPAAEVVDDVYEVVEAGASGARVEIDLRIITRGVEV